jgi:uncharacterized lipoprotein YmbA
MSGCGQQSYNKSFYILDTTRQGASHEPRRESILSVQRFTIDSAFESKGLVYRKSDFEYESDFYNEFLLSPAQMVTEKTRNWLSDAGIFQSVLDAGSYIKPTHILRANIISLYFDFRDNSTPSAVMDIRFFLITQKPAKDSVVFAKTYRTASKAKSNNVSDMVETLDYCLMDILTNLENDLKEIQY